MELEVNSQGYYRVILPEGRLLLDIDLMYAVPCSHVSRPMVYSSREEAEKDYRRYLKMREMTGIFQREVYISDDWKKESDKKSE